MAQSQLPTDPLAAHAVLVQRAEHFYDQRNEARRSPLPEEAQVELRLIGARGIQSLVAEVIDVSTTGMRLAAFADQPVQQGDRCQITTVSNGQPLMRWATTRWVQQHPLIQVFGVEFDADAHLEV